MSCEKYQSLPLDERSPEDRLIIELAKVSYLHALQKDETDPTRSSPKSGAGALGATQWSNETRGATI